MNLLEAVHELNIINEKLKEKDRKKIETKLNNVLNKEVWVSVSLDKFDNDRDVKKVIPEYTVDSDGMVKVKILDKSIHIYRFFQQIRKYSDKRFVAMSLADQENNVYS